MSDRAVDRREFLKLAGLSAVLAACGGATGTATQTPGASASASAKPTGSITVYSALNETTNNQFGDAFKAAYPGTTIDLLPLAAAGDLQTRITAEKASPKADIFIGGSSEFHDPLGKAGLLENYVSPNAAQLKPEFKDAAGFWTGWDTRIFGFIASTHQPNKDGRGKPPPTWDDLLGASREG